MASYRKAVEIDPRCSEAWFNKALAEDSLGHRHETIFSYRKFIEVAPSRDTQLVAHASKRLEELQAPEN